MLYFAYGANTHHGHMARRCPGAQFLAPALLPSWSLTFRGVADLRAARGTETHGALWDITEDDLAALDAFEGYPTLYGRRRLRVTSQGQSKHAIIYLMRRFNHLAPPSPAYLETLRQGYRDCGLPHAQLDAALTGLDWNGDAVGYRSRQWG